MKSNKKNKKILVAASVLALIALGAGTFAWFNSEDKVKNSFEGQIAGNDIQIVETFTPETDWEIGEEVNKDVAVGNVSEYDAIIRVSFEETLALLKSDKEILQHVSGAFTGTEPTLPVVIPSNVDYTGNGYTAANLGTTVSNVTVDGTEYAFKLFEKETQAADDTTNPKISAKYSFVGQWVSVADSTVKAKAVITKESGKILRDATSGVVTFAADVDPAISVVNKEYNDAKTADWLAPVNVATTLDYTAGTVDSYVDENILLGFVTENITATPTQDKWFYNAKDGYFYYIALVPSMTETAQLLDYVTLKGSADNTYSLLKYDLTVKAQGTQALKDAVTQTGWLEGYAETDPLVVALQAVTK